MSGANERGVRMLAVGAAAVAVVLAAIATVVVVTRSSGSLTIATGSAAPVLVTDLTRHVAATDVMRLRDGTANVIERGLSVGVSVSDVDLRRSLGLESDDVIAALSGRPILRSWEVRGTLSSIVLLEAKTIYVELRRAGKPVLLRWELDGSLMSAQRDRLPPLGRLPSVAPVADPLVGTIVKIDDTHFGMPRDTLDKLLADPPTYLKAARGLPMSGMTSTLGFKVFAIRSLSVLEAIGLKNGDVVRGVNGTEVASLDAFAEELAKVPAATVWTIDIERRRLPLILTISIR